MDQFQNTIEEINRKQKQKHHPQQKAKEAIKLFEQFKHLKTSTTQIAKTLHIEL